MTATQSPNEVVQEIAGDVLTISREVIRAFGNNMGSARHRQLYRDIENAYLIALASQTFRGAVAKSLAADREGVKDVSIEAFDNLPSMPLPGLEIPHPATLAETPRVGLEPTTTRLTGKESEERVQRTEGELGEEGARRSRKGTDLTGSEGSDVSIGCQSDAERWRKLIGCARLRLVGGAGTPMHHAGFEFWHEHPHWTTEADRELFIDFVDRIPSAGAGR